MLTAPAEGAAGWTVSRTIVTGEVKDFGGWGRGNFRGVPKWEKLMFALWMAERSRDAPSQENSIVKVPNF